MLGLMNRFHVSRLLAGVLLVSVFSLAVIAEGAPGGDSTDPCAALKTTCNEDRSVCCDWWTVSVDNGGISGAILEDSYEKLLASIESHKKLDARLCKYWGTKADCDVKFGTPHCSGAGVGIAHELFTAAKAPFQVQLTAATMSLEKIKGLGSALKVYSAMKSFERGGVPGVVSDRVRGKFIADANG
jgi:hypothetical protein